MPTVNLIFPDGTTEVVRLLKDISVSSPKGIYMYWSNERLVIRGVNYNRLSVRLDPAYDESEYEINVPLSYDANFPNPIGGFKEPKDDEDEELPFEEPINTQEFFTI